MLERILVLSVVFCTLVLSAAANATILRVDFRKATISHCKANLDFNYYHCIESTNQCVTMISTIKNEKNLMPDTDRAMWIFNRCFVNRDSNEEPSWM